MIATEIDIMVLVERVREAGVAVKAAHERCCAARDALKVATDAADESAADFRAAQNALVVAAGGTDMSISWR